MNTDTDLHLIFKNAAGKKVILKIENPKAGVTKAEIDFTSTGGDLVEAVEGYLRTTTTDKISA